MKLRVFVTDWFVVHSVTAVSEGGGLCMCVCMYVYMYVYVYVPVHICTYLYSPVQNCL